MKTDPDAAFAVRETLLPSSKDSLQSAAQLIPVGAETTEPVPFPAIETFTTCRAGGTAASAQASMKPAQATRAVRARWMRVTVASVVFVFVEHDRNDALSERSLSVRGCGELARDAFSVYRGDQRLALASPSNSRFGAA
jgi:heme/copper-type cytochrome/quinol oxidase subunit 3